MFKVGAKREPAAFPHVRPPKAGSTLRLHLGSAGVEIKRLRFIRAAPRLDTPEWPRPLAAGFEPAIMAPLAPVVWRRQHL
jgi:hypothetical protein